MTINCIYQALMHNKLQKYSALISNQNVEDYKFNTYLTSSHLQVANGFTAAFRTVGSFAREFVSFTREVQTVISINTLIINRLMLMYDP